MSFGHKYRHPSESGSNNTEVRSYLSRVGFPTIYGDWTSTVKLADESLLGELKKHLRASRNRNVAGVRIR